MGALDIGKSIDLGSEYLHGNNILVNLSYSKVNSLNFNPYLIPKLTYKDPVLNFKNKWNNSSDYEKSHFSNPDSVKIDKNTLSTTSKTNLLAGAGVNTATNLATNYISNKLFDDSDVGRSMGALFSSGVGAAGNTITENLIKGNALSENLGQNVGAALEGTALGITGNLVGQGIDSLGGHTALSRGIGAGVSSTIGLSKSIYDSIKTLNDVSKASKAAGGLTDALKAAQLSSKANLWGAGMSIAGSAIGAAAGPSKEYGGKYGSAVKTADTIYDIIQAGVGFIGPVGAIVSGAMALNKGLGNVFGSTDGMTMQDAILGSAFTPAPFKWLNMANASTTGTFDNQSWLNSMKANSFMGNAFGNLNDKFDKARAEAGKTYGTFSQSARRKADNNINFANYAWNKILDMADLNELLNIRSLYMSSINNLRYAQNIQGGWSPIARGRMGMKIFNNATNHNIGMRLLSGAALIDNKQMILSAQGGTKVTRPPRMRAHRKGDESKGLIPEEQEWWKLHEEEQKRLLEEETARKIKEKEEAADKFNQQVSTVMGAMTQQANETPFTGLEYQQAAENLRQKKIEKFHEAEKVGEATLMADLAISSAPLLLRGFRWAFNKAGLLVKVPVQKTIQLKSGITKSVLDNGKIRLSLPSHTDNKPRQFVLEPARDAGDNKYYVHMRMWDDIENKIPASNVTNEEKQQLFDALYDELPEGAEILFPKSGPGFYGTRGTVAGLQRLSKDSRFTPGTKGILQYLDKDGKTVRTYEGTSFIKTPKDIRYSLESDYKGKPVILSVPKTMKKADSDIVKMNEYHATNVLEYNQSTGNNVISIPFRTDYNGRLVKVLPNEEFNIVVRNKNTNAPSGSELNVGGMYSKNDDTVYLRNTGNPSNNYHEFLHSSHYGETNPEVTLWRLLQLIDEDKVSKMTPQEKAYYISINETPVHLRLLGERMNINIGDPYPGDVLFDKMLNEHGIGGATYYMKRDTSKAKQLLWKAFNGTLFSGLTAATLYNTNK